MIIVPEPDAYVRLEVSKTGLMKGRKHLFVFPAYRGTAERNPNRYEISLDARRIECKDEWLKPNDLKNVAAYAIKDMLDAERNPEIIYKSVSGLLTIRGKTVPVGVAYQELSPNVFTGTATIDMRLFGLKPPSAALGTIGTDPWMALTFRVKTREA